MVPLIRLSSVLRRRHPSNPLAARPLLRLLTGPATRVLFAGMTVLAATAITPSAHAQVPEQTGSIGDANKADCANIPGGNAPINRIARLESGLSVRNLDMTYYGRPIGDLTDRDYQYLEELWPLCGTFDEKVASAIATRVRKVVMDAKVSRAATRDWITATKAEIEALEPAPESIETINNYWQEMANREFEMTRADFDDISGFMTKQYERLYSGKQRRQQTLVNPFDPGAPQTRDPTQ